MVDRMLRGLERDSALGDPVAIRKLERERCRLEGHLLVFVRMFTVEEAGEPYPEMRIRVCRRCLEPVVDWRPGDTTRCRACSSPVRVRKSGYCVDCIIEASTKRRTPTGRRRFLLAWTGMGAKTHIIGELPGQVMAVLCGQRTSVLVPNDSMPTCHTCESARIRHHLREKDNAAWEGRCYRGYPEAFRKGAG